MPNIEYRGHVTLPVTNPLVRISGFSDISHIYGKTFDGDDITRCGLIITFDVYGTNPVYRVENGIPSCRKCKA